MAESDKISLPEELEESIDVFSEELERALQIDDFVWVENTKPKLMLEKVDQDKKQLEIINASVATVAPYDSFRDSSDDTVLSQMNYSSEKKTDDKAVVTSDLDTELLMEQQYWEQNGRSTKKVNNMKSKYPTAQRMTVKEHNIIDKAKTTPRHPAYYQFGIATTDILEMFFKKGYAASYHNVVGRGLNSVVIYSPNSLSARTYYACGTAVKVYKLSCDVRKNSTILKKVQRECDHLERLRYHGLVPDVIRIYKNVIVLQFLGFDQKTAPSISTLPLERSKEMYDIIVKQLNLWYDRHIVHGKLSSKYIRLCWDRPYILGWSHSVHTEHPQALKKLMRDCHFVTKFFKRRGVPVVSTEELFKSVSGIDKLSKAVLDEIQDKTLWQEQQLTNPNKTRDGHCRTRSNSRFNYIYLSRRPHSNMSVPKCAPRHPPGRDPGPRNPGSPGPAVVKRYDDIIKSQEDKREYRGLELSNRLKVLLISDSTTDKSAAALDVNVGYLSDPDELPGLAHFCEHMLFLGTEKYPEENEYNKFLSEHGGSSNAATSSDHTTYYFDVLPDYLARSLDIFAQFFIAPLFTESATGRELSAVNSEHEKNTSSDTWRLDQLNKSSASPDHAYHKFGTGNRETLETIPKEKGIDVRKELLKFHDTWYSANIMALVVVGRETLDELEAMVVPLFSVVEDLSVEAPSWPEHPFPPSLRQKRAYCQPVKDLRSLSIDFPIPDTRKHYKSGPGHYLSHLLGHEGPGSLLSELKARGWCNSLVGGTRIGGRGFGFFGVQVDLTEDGVEHIDDIVALVFQYIAMLRETKPQRWVWEEQKDLMAMEFRFKDAQEPRSLVTSHVNLVQEFPMQDVLSAYYILTEWKPELIDELLEQLTPENVRIGIVAQCFSDKCTQVEPWYGTKYLQEDIEPAKIKEWKTVKPIPALHLPPANEFIPARLDLEKNSDPTAETIAPVIVKDTPLMRLWFKQDNEFQLPKAFLTFDLVCPLAYQDPTNCNLTSVWVLLFRDSLQQFAYAAELAGLRWSIGNAKYGISITIDGYDDKQHVLLEKIMEHIVHFKADPQRFAIMKENHIRGIKNFEAEQPYQHAVYQQALCLSDVVWTRCQLLDAAETITPEQLNDYAARFIRQVHVEGLMFGNLTRDRALKIADTVENRIPKDASPLLSQQLLMYREVEIEKGAHYLRERENAVHKSSCASLYYACGVRATRPNAALELLAQTLSEPCFNILRTKEQLGYIVFSGVRRSNGTQGLRVIVQSDRHPAYLEERIEAFLKGAQRQFGYIVSDDPHKSGHPVRLDKGVEDFLKDAKIYLEEMPEEEFLKHRAALAASRLERPKRMATKASQMWSEISAQVYNFDRPRVEVDALNTISKEELLEFYKTHISESSKDRQKLSVYIISTAEGGAGSEKAEEVKKTEKQPVKITDLVEFKTRRRLYAHPVPFNNIPRKGAQCKL